MGGSGHCVADMSARCPLGASSSPSSGEAGSAWEVREALRSRGELLEAARGRGVAPATDEEAVSRLAPYTTDFDENARFAAIEGLAHRAPALIAPPLVTALLRPEEESGRIKRTILEVLARSRAPLGERAPEVAASMTGPRSDFRVDAGTVVGR